MKKAKQLWYVWLTLAVGFGAFAYFVSTRPAVADQPFQFTADNNIIIVPVQISRENSGIAMVDLKNETIWIYEIASRSSAAYNKLKLVAARSFKYDRMLDNFNSADPSPEQVRKIVMGLTRPAAKPEPNAPAQPAPAVPQSNEPNQAPVIDTNSSQTE